MFRKLVSIILLTLILMNSTIIVFASNNVEAKYYSKFRVLGDGTVVTSSVVSGLCN